MQTFGALANCASMVGRCVTVPSLRLIRWLENCSRLGRSGHEMACEPMGAVASAVDDRFWLSDSGPGWETQILAIVEAVNHRLPVSMLPPEVVAQKRRENAKQAEESP